ncbi:MAG: 3'-5' exonuclease domain-containing protein 2 [Bacteroidetes bacterium]|nr:3'-5' exonuclease domain-containing protein 2 [Bacteroidota bacterium]
MFRPKISKEDLSELPNIAFGGEIVVVDNYKQQSVVANYMSNYKIFGFDTESRAVFKKGVKNSISLLQLSAGDKVFLFRLNKIHLSRKIVSFLQSPNILKIGVAVRDDIKELQGVSDFIPHGFVDLQTIVKEWGIFDMSLQKITAIVLKGRLSKAQRLSNWNAINLTPAQLVYGATDAWICCQIYNKLLKVPKISLEEQEAIKKMLFEKEQKEKLISDKHPERKKYIRRVEENKKIK